MSIAPNGNIYATTLSEGILRSTDKGETWKQINEGIDWRICSAMGVNGKGEIFVSTAESTYGISKEKIYFSKDNGDTWENYTSNLDYIKFKKLSSIKKTIFTLPRMRAYGKATRILLQRKS